MDHGRHDPDRRRLHRALNDPVAEAVHEPVAAVGLAEERLESSDEREELVVRRAAVLADRHLLSDASDPAGLGQRELDVQRVLERVEAGDDVERAGPAMGGPPAGRRGSRPHVEGVEPLDKFRLAYKRGARAAVADDIEEFEALPEEWGYPGEAARDALFEFNGQCETGELSPERRLDAAPLVDPPYYVIEVIPAITFTFSGLKIDEQACVLDESGTPIPGLLAAGADAGGVFHRAYAGGLATALVFGLHAAATATAGRPASAGA